MLLDRVTNSLKYRFAYQISPLLSHIQSKLGQGKYGHGPRLTQPKPLTGKGIPTESFRLDIEDCWRFWHDLSYKSQQLQQLVNSKPFWQKIPQYYFTWKTIEPILSKPKSVYIDIASTDRSPYQEVVKLLSKTSNTYVQDLIFPPGINGNRVGGSAADLPLPDSSVDAMTLHCSFEHFEGNADTGFICEAGRVLSPGAKVCIAPLYLGEYAFVLCDPAWISNPPNYPDTVTHFFPRWGERHGRFYSSETLIERVLQPALEVGLRTRVIHFTNIAELDQSCYVHFGLILEKS